MSPTTSALDRAIGKTFSCAVDFAGALAAARDELRGHANPRAVRRHLDDARKAYEAAGRDLDAIPDPEGREVRS